MTHSKGVGGSAQHDLRREGTVTPPDHNLRRGGGTTSPREAKLEDPNLPHKPKSSREERRAAERAERRGDADEKTKILPIPAGRPDRTGMEPA